MIICACLILNCERELENASNSNRPFCLQLFCNAVDSRKYIFHLTLATQRQHRLKIPMAINTSQIMECITIDQRDSVT
ncbi:hypothetical protein MTP99_005231 [Tenebrio molitor]|nr:hypothetical protein MTP99_005231 [Tenebrio molitor]